MPAKMSILKPENVTAHVNTILILISVLGIQAVRFLFNNNNNNNGNL